MLINCVLYNNSEAFKTSSFLCKHLLFIYVFVVGGCFISKRLITNSVERLTD